MKKYNVTQTLKSGDSDPVEMKYAMDVSALDAAHAVVQILARVNDEPTLAFSKFEPVTLSINVALVTKS